MVENLGQWPFKRGPILRIRSSDGCDRMQYPWRWDDDTISLNLGVNREMAVNEIAGRA